MKRWAFAAGAACWLWAVAGGQWSVAGGRWPVISGRWPVVLAQAPPPAAPRRNVRAAQSVLRRLPQRPPEDGGADPRERRSRQRRRPRRGLGKGRPEAAERDDAAGRPAASRRGDVRAPWRRGSKTRSIARRPRIPIRAARCCTGSIAPNTPTRFAICWRSTSTRRRCCRQTTRASGFDNIADVLGVSPALMERYLSAADQVSALAVGDPAILPALVHLSRARRHVAVRSRRRAAARHARRADGAAHAAARRRIRDQGQAAADQPRLGPRPRVSPAARDLGGRRARAPRADGRARRFRDPP